MDLFGPRGDGGEYYLGSGHRKVGPMVLANAEGIHAECIGQHRLIDQVADDLGVGLQAAVAANGDIAERVESELKLLCHDALRKHDPAPKGSFGEEFAPRMSVK